MFSLCGTAIVAVFTAGTEPRPGSRHPTATFSSRTSNSPHPLTPAALLAHQLRRGGYLLEQIAPLIAQVRSAGGIAPLESMLRDWDARLSAKGRAMLAGAAALDAYLGCRAGAAAG
jgi:hypothetical protein